MDMRPRAKIVARSTTASSERAQFREMTEGTQEDWAIIGGDYIGLRRGPARSRARLISSCSTAISAAFRSTG